MNSSYLLIIVSILSTIGPISIATYLPSSIQMAQFYDVNISDIELSLSIFMFGFAVGQIFGGPLSDSTGRKFSSLIGLLGFSIFSFLIIFTNDILQLWTFRFIEAFFGGLIVVNATAIVRDMYSGKEAARFFSLLGSVRSIVPMLAPTIGAIILIFTSWKGIFIFLGLYSLILAILIFKDYKETYTYTKKNFILSYWSVLTHKKAMTMMFVLALGFSSLFSIVTKSSFIYMDYFKLTTYEFSFYYGLNFLAIVFFASLNVKLIKKFTQLNILTIVILIQIVLAGLFTVFNESLNIYFAVVLIGLYVGMNGLIYGNATALIMENFPTNAGVASALIGVIQFGLASLISSIIVYFHGDSLLPIGIGMIIISVSSLLILKRY